MEMKSGVVGFTSVFAAVQNAEFERESETTIDPCCVFFVLVPLVLSTAQSVVFLSCGLAVFGSGATISAARVVEAIDTVF